MQKNSFQLAVLFVLMISAANTVVAFAEDGGGGGGSGDVGAGTSGSGGGCEYTGSSIKSSSLT